LSAPGLTRPDLTTHSQTDKAFGVAPCTYLDVLALDADLTAFEKSLPPQYELLVDGRNRVQFASPPSLTEMRAALVHFSLSAEFVRLHRPFLGESLFSAPPRGDGLDWRARC